MANGEAVGGPSSCCRLLWFAGVGQLALCFACGQSDDRSRSSNDGGGSHAGERAAGGTSAVAGTGGVVGTGGVAVTGGVAGTGGVAAIGGLASISGGTGTGGTAATGGLASTSGGTGTGGVSSGGGAVGAGGASSGGVAGSDGSGGQSARTVSYVRDIQPIWDAYCVECHGLQPPKLAAPGSRLALDGKSRFPECNDAPFVVAGQPEQSFLYFKLTRLSEQPLHAACERWMPAAWNGTRDTPLIEIDPDPVTLIRQWILEGAHAD